jgi:hypothetical protein
MTSDRYHARPPQEVSVTVSKLERPASNFGDQVGDVLKHAAITYGGARARGTSRGSRVSDAQQATLKNNDKLDVVARGIAGDSDWGTNYTKMYADQVATVDATLVNNLDQFADVEGSGDLVFRGLGDARGNETVGAFETDGSLGDSASRQALT